MVFVLVDTVSCVMYLFPARPTNRKINHSLQDIYSAFRFSLLLIVIYSNEHAHAYIRKS